MNMVRVLRHNGSGRVKKKLESEMNYSWSQLPQFDYVPLLGHCCQELTRESSLLKCLSYIFTGFLLHAPFWQQIITKNTPSSLPVPVLAEPRKEPAGTKIDQFAEISH